MRVSELCLLKYDCHVIFRKYRLSWKMLMVIVKVTLVFKQTVRSIFQMDETIKEKTQWHSEKMLNVLCFPSAVP